MESYNLSPSTWVGSLLTKYTRQGFKKIVAKSKHSSLFHRSVNDEEENIFKICSRIISTDQSDQEPVL